MMKVVLKLDLHDDKAKQKAMKAVSTLAGVDSIATDMNDKKLTVTGAVDPVEIACKLRKVFCTEILSVGPAKEEKKDEGNKDAGNKDDKNKGNEQNYPPCVIQYVPDIPCRVIYPEAPPNTCVIL